MFRRYEFAISRHLHPALYESDSERVVGHLQITRDIINALAIGQQSVNTPQFLCAKWAALFLQIQPPIKNLIHSFIITRLVIFLTEHQIFILMVQKTIN